VIGRGATLRQVPVLAGLPDDLLERLAGEVREVDVPAGEWIMRAGEQAESLFVVRSGRVEVLDEGPPESVIRVLRRGDVLGELALLHEGVRSASARARRDSHLLELGRDRFEQLIREAPTFAVALTRSIGAQLAATRAPVERPAAPQTLAVVPVAEGADAAAVADLLEHELRRHGTVAVLRDDPGADRHALLARLERAEDEADRVLLIGTYHAPGDVWTDLCLREADVVVAVADGSASAEWQDRPAGFHGCELLVTGRAADPATVAALAPRELHVLPDPVRLRFAVEGLARRVAGRALGLVLSGGGARALAHLGVLDELRAQGVAVDRIGGVSLGAAIGGLAATGWEPGRMDELIRGSFVDANPSDDFVPPAYSLIRGAKTRRMLRAAFGELRIEELPSRFFCVSCDLVAREAVVHRTGPLWQGVYASLAIPGVFPAVRTPEGRLLVDGGVLDNLPVATMAQPAEGPVVAVDVTGRIDRNPARGGRIRLGSSARRALTGSSAEIPRLGETVVRTVLVGSADTVAAARRHADLVISPEIDTIGLLDWHRIDEAREAGRRAAREALAAADGALGA
jgi:NTE family protein